MSEELSEIRGRVAGLSESEIKCVIVLDADLPLGLIANTAAVLSLSLGHYFPLVGHDLRDAGGELHAGLTTTPVPILKSSAEELSVLRKKAQELEGVATIDVTDAAQTTKNYEDYEEKLLGTPVEKLRYLGVALYGRKKVVNKLTGNKGLLR